MKTKNPKTATVTLANVFFTPGQGETLLISTEADAFTESGKFPGEEPRDIYLTNFRFLDAEGNALPDPTAVWSSNAEADLSNLTVLMQAVELPDMSVSGSGWGQAGVDITEEFKAALVPGCVVEISYESEYGTIWLVFPDSAAGWQRIECGTATTNNSKDTAQIAFEEIAAILGEDVSAWGNRLQCEDMSNWNVYALNVGQAN